MFDDKENIVRVYGYVGDESENFWVDVTGEGRGTVRNLLVRMPFGVGDEIEYHRPDQRNVFTRLTKRSPLTTVGIVISFHEDDIAGQAAAETSRQAISREFERQGAFTEGGMGSSLLVAMEDITKAGVQAVAEEFVGPANTVEAFLLNSPDRPLDVDLTPTPDLPTPNPLPVDLVGEYLAQPVFTERYQTLVESGDVPSGIDLRDILHCSLNSATFDERLRRAWVSGKVDVVLVMGARLLGIGRYPLAQYPHSVFETFQFTADDWPERSTP